MKTVLIYDQVGEAYISFAVVDGDKSHLDGGYLNTDSPDEVLDELDSLIQNSEFSFEFPIDAVKEGAKVIVVGFVP